MHAPGPGEVEVSRLVVSELVTNCVRHAEIRADTPVRLVASLDATVLRIEIFDAGTDGAVVRRPPRFGDRPGGFGLDLVGQLSSAWVVERGPQGTTVCWNCRCASTPTVEAVKLAHPATPTSRGAWVRVIRVEKGTAAGSASRAVSVNFKTAPVEPSKEEPCPTRPPPASV